MAFGVKSSTSEADCTPCRAWPRGEEEPHAPSASVAATAAMTAARWRRIGAQYRRTTTRLEWPAVRRRVTFSRNLTLSLSRTCRCYCNYCAFATHRAHLHSPEEVIAILDGPARRHRVKELLVLTGELPEHNRSVAAQLAQYGFADFTGYVVWACERALERGILPHTNLGVLEPADLVRLREVTTSQGLM